MRYLEDELELIEGLHKYENIQILEDGLNEEAELNEIDELVELVNKALLYGKTKNK